MTSQLIYIYIMIIYSVYIHYNYTIYEFES